MRGFVRHLAAVLMLTFGAITVVTVTAPVAGSSPCQKLWLWNPATNECRPPRPPPPATFGRAHPSATVVHSTATVGPAVGARLGAAVAPNPCMGAVGGEAGVGPRHQEHYVGSSFRSTFPAGLRGILSTILMSRGRSKRETLPLRYSRTAVC